MPITTRRVRGLSPLDEDSLPGAMATGLLSERPLNHPTEGLDILLDIGAAVLTSRSCDQSVGSCDIKGRSDVRPRSLQDCEIFQSINDKTLDAMKHEMEVLWNQGIPLCIEVKGQATPTNQDPPSSVLLEQWSLQVNPRRVQVIPPSFLCQAVKSFLHFSQLRSWIVAADGRLPFQLLYRVCAPGDDGEQFSSTPDTHVFPATPLSPHYTLHVSVNTHPRQPHPPPTLLTTHRSTHKHSIEDLSTQMSMLSTGDESFPFSPPTPNPMSPKLLAGLMDLMPYQPHTETFDNEPVPKEEPPVLMSTNRVCPPSSSSPIPCFSLRGNLPLRGAVNKRRSCAITVKRPQRPRPPVRSNSCPAVVPSLCLLGTFEESVLNGRLEPCGFVDGFTAELGASGSFRPAHTTLSVGAAYFSLHSEHGGGSSPYLGHIDLTDVGRKGYRVPKSGTIQLTLFNPNKTVVKIYIVTYDLSDMPQHTQTFIRQKSLSKSSHGSIPALHYLIHLKFHCTKSGHVYVHKDIKIIFARRAPDTTDFDPSRVSVYTLTEGPTHPKYCPL